MTSPLLDRIEKSAFSFVANVVEANLKAVRRGDILHSLADVSLAGLGDGRVFDTGSVQS